MANCLIHQNQLEDMSPHIRHGKQVRVNVPSANICLPVSAQLLDDFQIFGGLNTVIAKVDQISIFKPEVCVGSCNTNGMSHLFAAEMTTPNKFSLTVEPVFRAEWTGTCDVIALWLVILSQQITQ